MSKSKYDNSDLRIPDTHGIGNLYETKSDAEELKLYMENLKLTAEMINNETYIPFKVRAENGQERVHKIQAKDLIPRQSEFERTRSLVIFRLNNVPETTLRDYQAKYEASSIFELAGRISNFIIDSRRKKAAYNEANRWIEDNPNIPGITVQRNVVNPDGSLGALTLE